MSQSNAECGARKAESADATLQVLLRWRSIQALRIPYSAFRQVFNPGIYLGVLLTALLVVAAYQARPTYAIELGTLTDEPMLRGFNSREVLAGAQHIPFRWTMGSSEIVFQDVGRQDFNVAMTLAGARPAGQPAARLTVQTGGRTLLEVAPAPELTNYTFSVPREAVPEGTLVLELSTNEFSPPGDPRHLGVILTRVSAGPGPSPDRFIEPPLEVLACLIAASALAGLALAFLGWGPGMVALGSGGVGSLAAWLVVADRLWLTSGRWYLAWPQALTAASLVVGLLWGIGGWALRKSGVPWIGLERRTLLTLVLAAFAVRLAGQLHPQIFIVDLGFHLHRFETVESGQLLFTIPSAEWGGHQTFYLPTTYLFMLPLHLLIA